MKKALIILAILILGFIGYSMLKKSPDTTPVDTATTTPTATTTTDITPTEPQDAQAVIGSSEGGRDIIAYRFGTGDNKALFVGGIHGGYAWNTSLLAYELIDFLSANPSAVPEGVQVVVIPVVNPDGLAKVVADNEGFSANSVNTASEATVAGRFNENTVDLNRNFDCGWKTTGVWQNKTVSGGTSAFSESESRAVRDFVVSYKPDAVVVWYSAAGGVYASSCEGKTVSSDTTALTNLFAQASGYPAHQSFDAYETSGDMVNWLAKNGIPAISVLLTDHTNTEWEKNRKGIEAVLADLAE